MALSLLSRPQFITIVTVTVLVLFLWNASSLLSFSEQALSTKQAQCELELNNREALLRRLNSELDELQDQLAGVVDMKNNNNDIVSTNSASLSNSEELTRMQRELKDARDRIQSLTETQRTLESNRADLDRRVQQLSLQQQQQPQQRQPQQHLSRSSTEDIIPVLVICYNRADYLKRTLDNLISLRPSAAKFPIIVSQDQTDSTVWNLLNNDYKETVTAIQHVSRRPVPPTANSGFRVYYWIAGHYRFALSTVFDKLRFDQVIIVEEDMEVAPDFFSYMSATLPLLRSDPHLYCVSAWNDNGKSELIRDERALRRGDFFGGLGWMLTRQLWSELGPKWAEGFWDDWMREPDQRKGRHCIYPEVPRSHTFGAIGSSMGQFYETHLKKLVLNDKPVDFEKEDLSYLQESQWDNQFSNMLQQMRQNGPQSARTLQSKCAAEAGDYMVTYSTESEFKSIARTFGLMDDFKAGVPRTAYHGTVWFHLGECRVAVTPA